MPHTKVYLKDIAKAAGVSIATVSYVLNNRHLDRIRESTAQKIREIAETMDYRPNLIGKALQSRKSKVVGLIIPDLAHPFFMKVAQVIEMEIAKNGYTLLIGSTEEQRDKQSDLVINFINRGVDGLIILPLQDSLEEISSTIKSDVPYVFTDRFFRDHTSNFVVTDNYYGTYALTQCLIKNGRKNISLVTLPSPMEHFQMRKKGFLDAMKEHGTQVRHHILELDPLPENHLFDSKINSLIASNTSLDAMLFTTDYLTMNGMRYLISHDLNERIEIAGFDEAEYYSIYPSRITYYRQPLKKIGVRLVKYILDQIAHPSSIETIQEVIKGDIVINK